VLCHFSFVQLCQSVRTLRYNRCAVIVLANASGYRCADVLEVNGLSVDWVSKHIYWTDGRKRTVEVAEFDGSNRRILITEQLSQPRAVYADPINGFVTCFVRIYNQEVVSSTPGRVAVMRLLFGWATVCGQLKTISVNNQVSLPFHT